MTVGVWCYAACSVVLYLLAYDQALLRVCTVVDGRVTSYCELTLGGYEWWAVDARTGRLELVWYSQLVRGRWRPIPPRLETWTATWKGPLMVLTDDHGGMPRVYTRRGG